jgi:hypothetical protein
VEDEKVLKKKLFLALLTCALLFSLAAEGQVGRFAEANPWIIFHSVDPLPDTISPVITILSPQNGTTYDTDTVLLSFNITRPQPPTDAPAGIASVLYYVDDNRSSAYFCNHYSSNAPPGMQQFTYSVNVTLPKGGHYIRVEANGVVLPGGAGIYGSSSSALVRFFTQPDPNTTPFPISDINAVNVVSPEADGLYFSNGTTIDIPLILYIDGTANWIQYRLTAQNYRNEETITGNTTLQGLSAGTYLLNLYVNNTITFMQRQFEVTRVNVSDAAPSAAPTLTPMPNATPTPAVTVAKPSNPETPTAPPAVLPSLTSSSTATSSPSVTYSSTQQPPQSPTGNPAGQDSNGSNKKLPPEYIVIAVALVVGSLAVTVNLKKRAIRK